MHVLYIWRQKANVACSLAKLESRLILAKIVWVFDIALAEPEFEWDSACTSSLLWSKPPLLVKLTRREGITVPPIDGMFQKPETAGKC